MEDLIEVKVVSHDEGPDCDSCGRKMSTVEFVSKVPNNFGRKGFVCFYCNDPDED